MGDKFHKYRRQEIFLTVTDREIVNYGPNSVVFGADLIAVTLEVVLGFGVNGQRSSKSGLRLKSAS